MFFSEDGIKKPKKNFNLLHLGNSEMCIMNIKASLLLGSNIEEYKISIKHEKHYYF